MVSKLSKSKFTKGFARKSFLGSAYPSMRQQADAMDRRMGTNVKAQFGKIDKGKRVSTKLNFKRM